jgi:NAD(P)-dependent dehydrogenase (short-subunit alcohol dehydrogenase family)
MSNSLNVLVTGATAGIGRFLSLDLARRGHRVFATGRRADALESLKKEAEEQGIKIVPVVLDVTDESTIEAAAKTVHEACGGALDVLINNAGYGQAGPLAEMDDKTLRRQFDTNVFGVMSVTRAFLPLMMHQRAGTIINVSSTGGLLTAPMMGAYHASKYALEAMSDALRMELSPFGIRVVVVEPGPIKSEITGRTLAGIPEGQEGSAYAAVLAKSDELGARMMKMSAGPEHVAKAVRKAIFSRWPRARYIAPSWHALPFMLLPFVPQRLIDLVFKSLLGLNKGLPAGKRETVAPASGKIKIARAA